MFRPILIVRQKAPGPAGPDLVESRVSDPSLISTFAPGVAIARHAAAALLLLLLGCEPPRRSFLVAIQRDCGQGNAQACTMLTSVHPEAMHDSSITPPVHSREIVQAILAGMRQRRLHAEQFHRQELPSLVEHP